CFGFILSFFFVDIVLFASLLLSFLRSYSLAIVVLSHCSIQAIHPSWLQVFESGLLPADDDVHFATLALRHRALHSSFTLKAPGAAQISSFFLLSFHPSILLLLVLVHCTLFDISSSGWS
ncbi:hypothetical protein N7461_002875, partial [Penicillium sp. DV-2018c]